MNTCDDMDAIVITKFGNPEVLEHLRVPKPVPRNGEVLVRVKAFGLNHAEMHMRKGEWDQWNPITGLECVGIVESCPGGEIPVRSTVLGVMGGMGRTIPGGYGEFVSVPLSNVVAIETKLSWQALAALPEVYSTAWSALFSVLELKHGESLLIRGATSTLGQAAVCLAVDAGADVTATTRREDRFKMLKAMGVSSVLQERVALDEASQERTGMRPRYDKTLNLIGNSVLLESIRLTRTGGRMLQAGWLGGLEPITDFNPMLQMESGVHVSLFHSKVLGTPDFPISTIPYQDIIRKVEEGKWDAAPAKVFEYKDIRAAHRLLDSGDAGGKIVVKH